MDKEKREDRIGFRCSAKLKEDLEEEAGKEKRKLGDYLNKILSIHVKKQKGENL